MEERIRDFFEQVLANKRLTARYINNLSYLEYLGANAISRTYMPENVDFRLLKHYLEEARHALLFRSIAEKIGGQGMTYAADDLLSEKAAEFYLFRVAAMVKSELTAEWEVAVKNRLTLFYVSALLEHRAVAWYQILNSMFRAKGMPASLTPILADEDAHVDDMYSYGASIDPHFRRRIDAFKIREQNLFSRYLQDIEDAAAEVMPAWRSSREKVEAHAGL